MSAPPGAGPDWRRTVMQMLAERELSPWEREFCQSLLSRATITERQAETLEQIAHRPTVEEVADGLRDRIEVLAECLIGEAPTMKARDSIRFYARGGLVVTTSGTKRGIWCSHGDGGVGGDPLDMVRHFRKCSAAEAIRWATDWLGERTTDTAPGTATRSPERPPADTSPFARAVWQEALPPNQTPAESYLRSRGLELPHDAPIRFHPACPRGRDERLPAMVALMTDAATGEPRGVHRTFLCPDGSGKIEHGKAKMMLGTAGIVRLVPDTEVTMGLGVAEGIETSLAIMQTAGWSPVWACGSAGAIAKFPALAGIESLTIFADLDDKGAGLSAARTCADRWREAGRATTIVKPPHGRDWLDALTEKGAAA